ncbi:MAG: hypothetical protein JSS81_02525 [Acidobacteria bacterium]|nr:hypothetical protein [Acidobacteriota bacterium]
MLNYGKTIGFFSIVGLFVLSLSCVGAFSKGQTSANPVAETPKNPVAETPKKEETSRKTPPSGIGQPWQTAVFRGLTMGKSKADELQKTLGQTGEVVDMTSVGNDDELTYNFDLKDEFKGRLVAYVDKKTKVVESIEIRPEAMSRGRVIELFGEDYALTGYSFDNCVDQTSDAAPLYEDPKGDNKYVEYRDRGIAVLIHDDDGTVQHILYLSEPLGSPVSKCYSAPSKKK